MQATMDADKPTVEWDADGYNYLAIGNSITKHMICDYWWNEIGMAASKVDKDYFHLVSEYLDSEKDSVVFYAYNGNAWEIQATDRAQVLGVWDKLLDESLDLITIQLSENASDLSTFESDFRYMVEYVKEKCPNARIIIIDDFWSDEKSEMKKRAIDGLDVVFVDLASIRRKEEYKAGMGTEVYDADGGEHIIEHEGVAAHPGDAGMRYYANKIIDLIKE